MQDATQAQEKRSSLQKQTSNLPKIQNKEVQEQEVRDNPLPVGAQWRAILCWTYPRVSWPGADASALESLFTCLYGSKFSQSYEGHLFVPPRSQI